jgi:hypothetical protein
MVPIGLIALSDESSNIRHYLIAFILILQAVINGNPDEDIPETVKGKLFFRYS